MIVRNACVTIAMFVAPAIQAAYFDFVSLPMSSVGYNEQTRKLYATVPSNAGVPFGNHLVEIDPVDGTIGASVFVGSEPTAFAASPDAAVGYVGLNGAGAVRRIDLSTMTAGLQFTLPSDSGSTFAQEIRVVPGAPESVAVSRRISFYTGVAIFDSGIQRATTTSSNTSSNSIAFAAQPDVLIGYNNETTGFTLQDIRVTPSGASVARSVSNVISGFGVRIKSSGNIIYSTAGRTVDATTLQLIGTFSANGPFAIDATYGFVAYSGGSGLITLFDRESFVPFRTIQIPEGLTQGQPLDMATCGAGCLALLYSNSGLAIIRDVLNLDPIFANSFE